MPLLDFGLRGSARQELEDFRRSGNQGMASLRALRTGRQAGGQAAARTGNAALGTRMASRTLGEAAQAGAEAEAQAANQRNMAAEQILEQRRRASNQFGQRLLGGLVGAGGSVLGLLSGAGAGSAIGRAITDPMLGNASQDAAALRETRPQRLPETVPGATGDQVMQQLGVAPMPGRAPITAPNPPGTAPVPVPQPRQVEFPGGPVRLGLEQDYMDDLARQFRGFNPIGSVFGF